MNHSIDQDESWEVSWDSIMRVKSESFWGVYEMIPEGITVLRKENKLLKSWLEDLHIQAKVNVDQEDFHPEFHLPKPQWTLTLAGRLLELTHTEYLIVDLFMNQRLKQKAISETLKIPHSRVCTVVNSFRDKYLYKEFWDSKYHKDTERNKILLCLRELLERFKHTHVTSEMLRAMLTRSLPEVKIPTAKSIRNYMNWHLKASYWRVNHIFKRRFDEQDK